MGNSKEIRIGFHPEEERFVTRRMVIKIGSSTITGNTENLDVNFMENIVRQATSLFHNGVEVIIVTSGAVASGKKGLTLEASSMFGQRNLITGWDKVFEKYGIEIGPLLLTDNHLVEGLGKVLVDALKGGILIINGQDAVNNLSNSEICKDNDRLAGSLAKLVNADTLLLLTDKDGVLDKDRKTIEILNPTAEIVIFDESKKVFNGGIVSKIKVAREFSGRAIIADGKTEDVVLKVARGEKAGTEVKSIQSLLF